MFHHKIISVFTILFLAGLLFGSNLSAQTEEQKALSPDQFNFGYDIGRFRAQNDYVLVEIYYSIFRSHLQFVSDENRWKATFIFKAEILQNDSALAADEWQNFDYVDSLEHIKPNQKLFGLGYFAIKPGNYMLKVTMTDINSKFERQKERDLSVEPLPKEQLALSDIELATQIKPNAEKNRFYKNGYLVIPNPDQFYGTGLPMLTFYSEIYNLKIEAAPDSGSYSVQYRILNGDGQAMREFPARVRVKPGESAVEASAMNIISFRSGTYFLEIEVKDLSNGITASRQKKFFIYREGDLALSDSAAQKLNEERLQISLERIYKNMSSQNLDEEFESATYLATGEERKIYKKLDFPGKQTFLQEFWRKRDKTPETPQNEFREEYLKLVNTANKDFSGFKKGWKTDRGRVLLIYGVPDEIERMPLKMDAKAHHIWKYFSIQGGVEFIFVDKQGFGDFELVHSTARGEISDFDWERWINPNR